MSHRQWNFSLENQTYILSLETKWFRQLSLDQFSAEGFSLQLDRKDQAFTVENDDLLGGDLRFDIGPHTCRVQVRSAMMTTSFHLEVDGQPVFGQDSAKATSKEGTRKKLRAYGSGAFKMEGSYSSPSANSPNRNSALRYWNRSARIRNPQPAWP